MRGVTKRKVWTLMILMRTNGSSNRHRLLGATVFIVHGGQFYCYFTLARKKGRTATSEGHRFAVQTATGACLKLNILVSDMLLLQLRDGLQYSHKPAH